MKTVPRLLRQGIWIIFNFELGRFKFGTTITACLSGITLCISVWNSRLKCANGNFVNWIDKYLDKGFTCLVEHEQSLKQRLGSGQIIGHEHFKTIFCNKEVKSKHTGIFRAYNKGMPFYIFENLMVIWNLHVNLNVAGKISK